MESSRHCYIDQYGYHCEVEIDSEDDIVVFNSIPSLSFDFKKHGIRIRRSINYDYVLRYVIKNEQIFLRGIGARLSFLCKKIELYGVKAETFGKWSFFHFDDIPVEYSGTLTIGKNFDYRYWQHEDKATPVPFSPEVYKDNGYIELEKGKIIKKELVSRDK